MEKEVLERITKIYLKNVDYKDVTDLIEAKGISYFAKMESYIPEWPSESDIAERKTSTERIFQQSETSKKYFEKWLKESTIKSIVRIDLNNITKDYVKIYEVGYGTAKDLYAEKEDVRYIDRTFYWVTYDPLEENETIQKIVPKWWKDVKNWKE